MKLGVAILGGTGFGAGELMRLLSNHPEAKMVAATSRSSAKMKVSSVHPHLSAVYEQVFLESIPSAAFDGFDGACIVSALPHGESGKAVSEVSAAFPFAKIIDLSGDLRLKDVERHNEHYKTSTEFLELRSKSIYGLPEVHRNEIETASLVANPGCLATAATLSLLPFVKTELHSVHLHLATGSSGSGKEPKMTTHHPIRHANFLAYKALDHQHTPEVIQCLNDAGGNFFKLPFVAHSLPISRGILCTTFMELEEPASQESIEEMIFDLYADHPFIRFKGSSPAEIENVVGSNFCDISVKVKDNQIVVHSAIDNLVKGMAGQAIHNMNLMFGIPETTGLWTGGWRPV
jgi:N-acetyl-gamma-glutamyl-phosphate reductase common form